MKIVSAEEMRQIDRITTARFGVPSTSLMERAGTAVADLVLEHYPALQRIGVVCGKGNNGGDGLVAGRKLKEAGREVSVLLLADPAELSGDAAEMFKKLPFPVITARNSEDLKLDSVRGVFGAELRVDAILGTGFRPPVTGVYAAAIQMLNRSAAPTVAVDTPSGANADLMGVQTGDVVRAEAVVSFTAPRPAHVFGSLTAGPTVIAPIGSPAEAISSSLQLNLSTPADIASLFAPRPAAANKGKYGHVLVVGGSLGKVGAAAMAGMSALRIGAGLSTVATPKSVLRTVASFHPEIMTEPLEETDAGTISLRAMEYGRMDELIEHKTVLAIGPGISRDPETAELVHNLVSRYHTPTVIDADGLNAFEGSAEKLGGSSGPVVITPHPGEMARLIGSTPAAVQRDRLNIARSFARDHQVLVVLKGHRTLVAHPDGEVWVNPTGNPGMATGGTGDILTGMIAGLLAQYPEQLLEAVLAAVYVHGLAGDVAREIMGEQCLVATDLIRSLPQAIFRVARDAKSAVVKIGA